HVPRNISALLRAIDEEALGTQQLNQGDRDVDTLRVELCAYFRNSLLTPQVRHDIHHDWVGLRPVHVDGRSPATKPNASRLAVKLHVEQELRAYLHDADVKIRQKLVVG